MRKEQKQIAFVVPYPGAAASSNNGYEPTLMRRKKDGSVYAGQRLTDEAAAFKAECVVKAREAWSTSKWLPGPKDVLYIGLRAKFPTKVHCDIENLRKFIQDGIKEALDGYVDSGPFYNDRDWLPERGEPPQYERGCEPSITVTVKGG